MKLFDLGLKENWRAFKEYVESFDSDPLTEFYFVIEEDDCGDEACVFTSHSDLDEWLEKTFWKRERYDTRDLEDSMDDFKVWKLISESDVKRLKNLYEGAKPTSITIDGERYFRKQILVNVEQTVTVSTNFY